MKKVLMITAIAIVLFAAGGWIYKTVSAEDVPVTTTSLSTATTYYYGPMMGRGGGFRGGCGAYPVTTGLTYEWLYLHLDADEKILVDTYHADLLATYDFTVMDAAARLVALSDIHAALSDYIVASEFVTGVNP
ncbi:MAG: hypothetical protein Q8N15_05740 [Bacillota bacterium]|nr:hypothetical protein [Bacillota bacterium]